jgi:hypothetical protein
MRQSLDPQIKNSLLGSEGSRRSHEKEEPFSTCMDEASSLTMSQALKDGLLGPLRPQWIQVICCEHQVCVCVCVCVCVICMNTYACTCAHVSKHECLFMTCLLHATLCACFPLSLSLSLSLSLALSLSRARSLSVYVCMCVCVCVSLSGTRLFCSGGFSQLLRAPARKAHTGHSRPAGVCVCVRVCAQVFVMSCLPQHICRFLQFQKNFHLDLTSSCLTHTHAHTHTHTYAHAHTHTHTHTHTQLSYPVGEQQFPEWLL